MPNENLNQLLNDNIYHYDILISSFISALNSYRKDSVLIPFPPDYKTNDGDKDYIKLEQTIKQIPPINELLISNFLELQSPAKQLLVWILDNNLFVMNLCKAHEMANIERLTKQNISAPEPNYIFKLSYINEVNDVFIARHYAYHGSSLENLYSILFNGLQPEFGKNGLFGDGIYLSSELSMSLNYSRRGKSWENSILGKYLSFTLVCELYDDGSSQLKCSDGKETPETYFILKNKKLAKIRYLLIYTYPDKNNATIDKNTQSKRIPMLLNWCKSNSWMVLLIIYAIFLFTLAMINSHSFRSLISKTLPFKRKTFPPDIY